MNKKILLLVLILAFGLLIGGASVLYYRLGQDLVPDQLSAQPPQNTNVSEETAPQLQQAPDFTVYDLEGTK